MKILYRLTHLYLLLPFILFCLGWLRLFIALPIIVLILWIFWRLDANPQLPTLAPNASAGVTNYALRITPHALLVIFLWVFLSGVGGYAFQNWDHNWRNAVLRDLIHYDLPVIYSAPASGPVKMLVYYVGYWLPAALIGKVFGWGAANFVLFLWTWLGVVLVVAHLSQSIKTSMLKAALLLIFFSGMDAVGALLYLDDYPRFFPPFSHLEAWMYNLQYSSFTTQLFWTFNQAVPGWLCILLIMSLPRPLAAGLRGGRSSRRHLHRAADAVQVSNPLAQEDGFVESSRSDVKILAWSLSFFFSPLISIGLLPYLIVELWADIKNIFKSMRYDVLAASALIAGITFLYFSSNPAAQERGMLDIALPNVVIFFLLEGGLIWLLLTPQKWRDPRWMLTGALLFLTPFFQLGNGIDFVMRASIAPLFYLMLIAGEALHAESPRVVRITLYALLLVGALTPLYEINRSVYRTAQYYLLDENQRAAPRVEPAVELETVGVPEYEHPNALAADSVYSFAQLKHKLVKNFVANVRQSVYYRYLAP